MEKLVIYQGTVLIPLEIMRTKEPEVRLLHVVSIIVTTTMMILLKATIILDSMVIMMK